MAIKEKKYEDNLRTFRLFDSELKTASDDGVVIVTRPQESRHMGVFALNTKGFPIGVTWYLCDSKSDVPVAITSLMRDLDKFYGLGEDMSHAGRMRVK